MQPSHRYYKLSTSLKEAVRLFSFLFTQFEIYSYYSLFIKLMKQNVESKAKRLGFSNMYANLYDDKLNVGSLLGAQLIWTLIYAPIAWYIEKIIPGKYK